MRTPLSLRISRKVGAFSQRDMVGCEDRSSPVGQARASELEGGVPARMIEIVRIFITAGDGENARAQDTAERMGNQQGIAWIGDDRGELVSQSAPALCLPQQHHASIRRDAPTIESGGDFLAIHGRKREPEKAVFCHGGRSLDAIL